MCTVCSKPYRVAVIRKDGDAKSMMFDNYQSAKDCYNSNTGEPSVYLFGHTDGNKWVQVAAMH